ncbi:MAG: 2-polyprenyl-3-methyl-5-hydroxy-6-metoxy-1,4-benzoquinol methylase [Gammaproteobacteria bacterium]|jgi:phosphoethanolamine N-methyltransferase
MYEPINQEYDNKLTTLLEGIWGEGFLSPGGVDEVNRYLETIDLVGKTVLDIGCGLGGVDIHLVKQLGAASVTGIDIEEHLIERCQELAKRHNLSNRLNFQCVEPGPFPFENNCFDIVTSKDSIIHIEDKASMARDIFRIIKPGGWFAASDWLAGYESEPSPEMEDYLAAEGLDFGLASATIYKEALVSAGFINVEIIDRNHWYKKLARLEHQRLSNDLYKIISNTTGRAFVDHEIEVWEKMIIALDQGQLRPGHLRGQRPD